jgi:aminoglycoside phosphotransferase (APT) family kinase protein
VSNTRKLLQQVRHSIGVVLANSESHEHQTMLDAADLLLTDLLLQESPEFYLDFIAEGKKLLQEGQALAKRRGTDLPATTLRDDLTVEIRDDVFDSQIELLMDALAHVVYVLDDNKPQTEKEYLDRISAWEASLYKYRGSPVESTTENIVKPITQDMVQTYLEKKRPDWSDLRITNFEPLYGGFSKKTILVDTEDEVNGGQSIVLRLEQGLQLLCYDGSDVAREFHMIQLMNKLGLPVPAALWLEEDTSILGGRFIVSEKASGSIRGSNHAADESVTDSLVESMFSSMLQMHRLEIDCTDPSAIASHMQEWLPHKTISEATRYYVEVFIPNEIERTGLRVTPDLARAIRWAQRNVPECNDKPVVLHMDYSFNNILFDGDEVSAILDWETSRMGDPADEIIYTQNSVAEQLPMAEFLARYKAETGYEITEYRLAYAQVVKTILTIIGCQNAFQLINTDDRAPIPFGTLAYRYIPFLCANVSDEIARAEAIM